MNKTTKILLWIIVIVLVIWVISLLGSKKSETDSIVIGALYPLSGATAYYGESGKRGVDLAIKQAQVENPDIDIKIYTEDNGFNPKTGVNAYNKLKFEHTLNAIITQTSPVAVAVLPLAKQDGILQMAFSASADTYSSPDDLSFRTTGGTLLEADAMIDFIKSNYQKIAILYMNNEIGTSIAKTLTSEINKLENVQILSNESFPVETNDFRTTIAKIKQSEPDAIYIAGLASHTATFLNQLEEIKVNIPILSFRTAEDPILIKNAGILAEQVIFTSAFDANTQTKEVKKFVDDFKKEYNLMPDNYAAEGYFATQLVVTSIKKCSTDSKCIFDFISSLKNYPSVFGNISYDKNGDVFYPFFLKTVRGGEFVKL